MVWYGMVWYVVIAYIGKCIRSDYVLDLLCNEFVGAPTDTMDINMRDNDLERVSISSILYN